MAENMIQLDSRVLEKAGEKPLLSKFIKYFKNTPANMIRSIDLGKSLCKFFAPETNVPEDPATLLGVTNSLFSTGIMDDSITDETFLRFMIDKILREPSLITFDMVADLVESDTYKKFGSEHGTEDNLVKTGFEKWILENSVLSKVDLLSPADVVLNQDGMKRVLKVLKPGMNTHATIINQIDEKITDFDSTYVKNISGNGIKDLSAIAENKKNNQYIEQVKNTYKVLCSKDEAEHISDVIESSLFSAKTQQERNAIIEGYGYSVNKVLTAVGQRKGWSEEKLSKVYLKFPVEKRAEQFEQKVDEIETKSNQEISKTEQTEAPKDKTSKKENKSKRINPVFDVVKTFAGTLGGATAISTISSIPGVGKFVGPALGVTMVATAGISSAVKNYRKAKIEAEARGEKLNKAEARKIALKAGGAMAVKALPYAASMVFGGVVRVVGATVVGCKTYFDDIKRREEEQRKALDQLETQEKIKLSFKDKLGAFAYGVAKGAAVYFGGQLGTSLGSSIGSNITVSHDDGELTIKANTKQMKSDLSEKFSNSKLGKLIGNFPGLRGNEVSASNTVNVAGVDDQLSDDSVYRLSQIKDVELTDNARATAHVENHRQYVDGKQQDWYTANQEHNALQALDDAGVKDSVGVLRKVGSASRLLGGEFQNTMDNLLDGKITNQDVDQIFDALKVIDAEGGLAQQHTAFIEHDFSGVDQSINQEPSVDFIKHDYQGVSNSSLYEPEDLEDLNPSEFLYQGVSQEKVEDINNTQFIKHDYNYSEQKFNNGNTNMTTSVHVPEQNENSSDGNQNIPFLNHRYDRDVQYTDTKSNEEFLRTNTDDDLDIQNNDFEINNEESNYSGYLI
ncbi:MAG: hypothetical protein MJ054_01145 [Clostridia bacterium]|nr:hypothetical protein [Clostridia bacterium]